MSVEALFCRCGEPIRLVRLTREVLTFGHVQNPKQHHHAVRLARSAHVQPSAVRSGSAVLGLTEGPRDRAPVPTAASGDARPVGPSDPALRLATEPRRARRVHAGSPLHGDSMEPGSPRSGSAVAASGSRST